MSKKLLPLLLVLVGAGLLIAYYPWQSTLIYSDSYETLIIAKRILGGLFLDLPLGTRGMAWEPLFYNRINFAALIAGVAKISGLSLITSSALINFSAYLATVLGMFLLAKALFKNTWTKYLAVVLTAVSPSLLFWKSYLVSDPLAIALLVWGLVAFSTVAPVKAKIRQPKPQPDWIPILVGVGVTAFAIAIRLEYVAALPAIYLLLREKMAARRALEKITIILLLAASAYALNLYLIGDLGAFLSFSGILVHNWGRYLGIPVVVASVLVAILLLTENRKQLTINNLGETKVGRDRRGRHEIKRLFDNHGALLFVVCYLLILLVSRDWSNPLAQVQYFMSFLTLEFWVITAACGYLILFFRWSKETAFNRSLLLLVAGFSLVYFDFYFQHAAVLVIPLALFTLGTIEKIAQGHRENRLLLPGLIAVIVYVLYSLTTVHFINFPKLDYQQVEAAELKSVINEQSPVVYTGFPQALYYLNGGNARYLENVSLLKPSHLDTTYVVVDRKMSPQTLNYINLHSSDWEKVDEFAMPKETLVDEEGLPTVKVYKITLSP